jgi:hypothetical protein
MKHLLLFMFLLLSGMLFSQQRQDIRHDIVKGKKTGEIVKGKKVAYGVWAAKEWGYEIKNVEIQDTIWREHPTARKNGVPVLKRMRRQIDGIVLKHFKLKECFFPYEEIPGTLGIGFIVNKNLRVEKITFAMSTEENFWINLPVDRFYKIEKEILEKVRMTGDEWDDNGKYWDFENTHYYMYSISYNGMRDRLRAMRKRGKMK